MGIFSKDDPKNDPKDNPKGEPKSGPKSGKKHQAHAGKGAGKGAAEAAGGDDEWFIPEESRTYLEKLFAGLRSPVALWLFTKKGLNDEYNEFTHKFTRDLARLTDKIEITEFDLGDTEAKERGIEESPTLLVAPDRYDIRFTGAPAGEEGRSLIEAVVLCSLGESGLRKTSRDLLAELDEKRQVRVFVSPTCPYCPGQVGTAVRTAVERPELISVQVVEITENQGLARRFNVGSVPHTVINDTLPVLGLEPEERFVVELTSLTPAEELLLSIGRKGTGAPGGQEAVERDVVIVGGGPAGLTAAIYAERAGLRSVVLEKKTVGGQIAVTPIVENYPGIIATAGGKLVELLSQHAREYVDIHEFEEVTEIKVGRSVEVVTPRALYRCRALILATGAQWKMLGVPGEKEFYGNGVSHCATCDAALYKGGKVAVVGGGNTALTDALYLRNLGVDVTIVHRRAAFRAQEYLQKSVQRESVPVLWNTRVTSMMGKEKFEGLRLENTLSGETSEFSCDGVFLAIGERSNTVLARQVGLRIDEDGNIDVDRAMRTSIPRVYAAGDVTGGLRQIVTAVGAGATAAMTAFEDLKRFETEEQEAESAPA
ncbi:Pyridine nucleotide-disulfide oxidoreductase, FAD/NAD(P)-binding domain containing protein [Desulfovibrio sp. X2]|uniref:FAD-dependent oxidoreductase n=1 Tax=Desulfovibrio sp. X2 TaxID=941449 RepID=UPI000358B650|nr:FAD-dependent oxidoreductase [Desulfovibrio sp. X2]EPR37551.1 Pyridine nucleotide-disulfide oxidoreductase, FAD/NAD(P)-binding domain containing protein [Desulfovibrio sp. X2]